MALLFQDDLKATDDKGLKVADMGLQEDSALQTIHIHTCVLCFMHVHLQASNIILYLCIYL